MSQSCETLVTKINEWQKAILELEGLADEFLNTSDQYLNVEIEDRKREIISLEKEYQILAYPELPNGENLCWLEKELIKELAERTEWDEDKIKVKDNHLIEIDLSSVDLSQFSFLDFSLFHNLKVFHAVSCKLKKCPRLPGLVEEIWIWDNDIIKTERDKEEIRKKYYNAEISY